ncbi:MAG: hypothetical protein ACRCWI_08715 [Brevinema sp.]
MKIGMRKPSLNKSISAMLSPKRRIKNALGLKAPRGWGWATNPKKFVQNKIYKRTTFSIWDLFKKLFKLINYNK